MPGDEEYSPSPGVQWLLSQNETESKRPATEGQHVTRLIPEACTPLAFRLDKLRRVRELLGFPVR